MFNGFSDADLMYMNGDRPIKNQNFKEKKKNVLEKTFKKSTNNTTIANIPDEAKLSSKVEIFSTQSPERKKSEGIEIEISSLEDNKNEKNGLVKECNFVEVNSVLKSEPISRTNVLVLDPKIEKNMPDLEEFERNRLKLENENYEKKQKLQLLLEDRTKKTVQEAKRLNEIEAELKKLDAGLSNDVSILRKQIELASLEFMEAQKKFDKAEKEYLTAKVELFNKNEKKVLLTSHLCSIIEQNELRKAQKLSDLMSKLEISSKPVLTKEEKNEKNSDCSETC